MSPDGAFAGLAGPDERAAALEPRLFACRVMHLRLKPVRHQFRHQVLALWLDLDRIAETASRLRLLGHNRFAPFGFYERDHGPRDGGALRPWVEARLAEAGAPAPARLMLLSFPRVFGYVFNPLSVYYGYDASGRLTSMLYEVKNTIGGQHAYPVRIAETAASGAPARHTRAKRFYVSPFIGMDKTYRFTAPPPGERLALRIEETDAAGPELIATWNGQAEPLTDARLARRLVTHPLTTLRVYGLIHWHALRLLLKGAPAIGPKMASAQERSGSSSIDEFGPRAMGPGLASACGASKGGAERD